MHFIIFWVINLTRAVITCVVVSHVTHRSKFSQFHPQNYKPLPPRIYNGIRVKRPSSSAISSTCNTRLSREAPHILLLPECCRRSWVRGPPKNCVKDGMCVNQAVITDSSTDRLLTAT